MPAQETIDELVVKVSSDYNDFTHGMDTVESELVKAEKKINDITNQMAAFGTAMSLAVTAPLAIIGKSSLGMSIDVKESANLFVVSMKDMAKEGKQFSKSMQDDLGLFSTEVERYLATMFNMTTSMGMTSKTAYELSEGITNLTYDIASFYNLGIEESFAKLQSGLTGEIEPLRRIGILVDENTIKQVAYANGIAETGAELTQLQKVEARYLAIMQQTTNAQGDLARTIDDTANRIRIFQDTSKQAQAVIGSSLEDSFRGLLSAGQGLLDWFIDLDDETRNSIVQMGLLAAAIGPVTLAVSGLSKAMMFLMANPWVAVISGIGMAIGAIALNTLEARTEQERYNATLERLEEIKQRGLREDEITSLEGEINEAQQLVAEYDNVIVKMDELRKTMDEKLSQGDLLEEEQLQLELFQTEIDMLEEKLYELGYSYDTAKEMIRLYNQEVAISNDLKERMNSISSIREQMVNKEIEQQMQLYSTNAQNVGELKTLIEEYNHLNSLEALNVEQKTRLIDITQTVSSLLGNEVLQRNKKNEIVGLNIETTNLEIASMENNSNAQKASIKEIINAQITWTKEQLEQTQKRIKATAEEIRVLEFLHSKVMFGRNEVTTGYIDNLRREQEALNGLTGELEKEIAGLEQSMLSLERSSLGAFKTDTPKEYKSSITEVNGELDKQEKITKSIQGANEELRKSYQKQTDEIKQQQRALEQAYKNNKKEISESEKFAIDAIDQVIKKQEEQHKDKLDQVKKEKNARLEAIDEEIAAIEGAAKQEDRTDNLDELQGLYDAYKHSTTAEGKARAEELRKQIRDIKNEERIEDLEGQKRAIEEDAQTKEDALKKEYDKTISHYEGMKKEVEQIVQARYQQLEVAYENESKLLEQQLYIQEGLYQQANATVEEYAEANKEIYVDNAEQILKMLAEKEKQFYNQGEELAKQFQQGLQEQLDKVKNYEQLLTLGNVPAPPVNLSGYSSGNSNTTNNNYITMNDFGDKNLNSELDVNDYTNAVAQNIDEATRR